MSIKKMTISERRSLWKGRGGIHWMLMNDNYAHKDTGCNGKEQYSFNQAVEVSSYLAYTKGRLGLDIYFCGHCFRYHLGRDRKRKTRNYCVWCGNWIKKSKQESHDKRCN